MANLLDILAEKTAEKAAAAQAAENAKPITVAEQSDMFQTMQTTNKALLDVLMGRVGSSQPTYIQAAQPAPTSSPNYLLYVGIGIAAFVLLRKAKIL
jgi:hypothetical protein